MLNGHRKEKDLESRERWIIMRRLMWSSMWANAKKGFVETQICVFPWEKKDMNVLTIEENEKLVSDVEKVKAFYERIDGKKNEA